MGLLIEINLPTGTFCIGKGKTDNQGVLIEFDTSLDDIAKIKPEALDNYLKQKPEELKRDQGVRKVEKLATSNKKGEVCFVKIGTGFPNEPPLSKFLPTVENYEKKIGKKKLKSNKSKGLPPSH